MKKAYKWKVPESFCSNKEKEKNFLGWVDAFSFELCYAFGRSLPKKIEFTDDEFNYSQDDWDHAIGFQRDKIHFIVNFRYRWQEESGVFDVEIIVVEWKKFLIFSRKLEPSEQVFDEFHDAVLEIAKAHNIDVFEI